MSKKTEHPIEIDGVILTPEAIQRLKSFQQNNNEELLMVREQIVEAICYIATRLDISKGNEAHRLKFLLTDLSHIREYLNDLGKPDCPLMGNNDTR